MKKLLCVFVLVGVAFSQGFNGKIPTFSFNWTPDSTLTQVCSSTVTANCADHLTVFQQVGAAPDIARDVAVVSTPILISGGTISTSYSVSGPQQPFGTATFYVVAYARDAAGTLVNSVASNTANATFKPNAPDNHKATVNTPPGQ